MTTSRSPYCGELFSVALIVPDSRVQGLESTVGVTGEGSKDRPKTAVSTISPAPFKPSYAVSPNAVKVRLCFLAMGKTTPVKRSRTSLAELKVKRVSVHRTRKAQGSEMHTPMLSNAVVYDNLHLLWKRIHLHTAPNDVHSLRCGEDSWVLRIRSQEHPLQLRECIIILRGPLRQLTHLAWSGGIVLGLALDLLKYRAGALQRRRVWVGLKLDNSLCKNANPLWCA